MEYTQEQIDQMLIDAKKGLFTDEDVTRRVTAEVDRRVESGIKNGVETQKKKWEEEFTKTATLTAEEKAELRLKEQMDAIATKESAINRKSNSLTARDKLTEAGIPKSHYDKFLGMLVNDSEDLTTANVENFITMFNDTKTDIETTIKADLTKIKPPINKGEGGDIVTKTQFDAMSYSQKLAFKTSNPEEYKNFMK